MGSTGRTQQRQAVLEMERVDSLTYRLSSSRVFQSQARHADDHIFFREICGLSYIE